MIQSSPIGNALKLVLRSYYNIKKVILSIHIWNQKMDDFERVYSNSPNCKLDYRTQVGDFERVYSNSPNCKLDYRTQVGDFGSLFKFSLL